MPRVSSHDIISWRKFADIIEQSAPEALGENLGSGENRIAWEISRCVNVKLQNRGGHFLEKPGCSFCITMTFT